MKILHLTLKKKWFDMILSGEKKEEYREYKPYWRKRFVNHYTHIKFRNGYSASSPSFLCELVSLQRGLGIIEWGAPEKEAVYILKLGAITSKENIK